MWARSSFFLCCLSLWGLGVVVFVVRPCRWVLVLLVFGSFFPLIFFLVFIVCCVVIFASALACPRSWGGVAPAPTTTRMTTRLTGANLVFRASRAALCGSHSRDSAVVQKTICGTIEPEMASFYL